VKGNEALISLLSVLERLDVPYMVTGSYATNVYGLPRSTKDADVIVEAESDLIFDALDQLRPPLRPNPQLLFETVTATRRWIVEIESSPFVIEVFLLNNHAFDRSRFDRRGKHEFLTGVEAWLPTAEDVIVQKLRWVALNRREKDFSDACNVMMVQARKLDWPYIERWCAELGASDILAEARAMAEV
jgi:hypothetical protein